MGLPERLYDMAERILLELQGKAYENLCALPPVQSEEDTESKATISVYREEPMDGMVKIVVQVFDKGFLGIHKVAVGGFTMSKEGKVQKLADEELYDYS